MFASIKEQRNISCSFTISGATRDGLLSTTTIQCSGRQELEEWVAAIRRATEATLAGPRPNPNNSDPRFASPTDLDRIRTARQQREEMSGVIEAIAALSRNCAECGAAAPDWTLLNHGALICIQCSGKCTVHYINNNTFAAFVNINIFVFTRSAQISWFEDPITET